MFSQKYVLTKALLAGVILREILSLVGKFPYIKVSLLARAKVYLLYSYGTAHPTVMSSSNDAADLTCSPPRSSPPRSSPKGCPGLFTYRHDSAPPHPPEECWELDLKLDYDDSKVSEEERQLIQDAYAGIDVNAKGYVTRVPPKGPKTTTSSQPAATQKGSNACESSQGAGKQGKGNRAPSAAVTINADKIAKRRRKRIRRMRRSN